MQLLTKQTKDTQGNLMVSIPPQMMYALLLYKIRLHGSSEEVKSKKVMSNNFGLNTVLESAIWYRRLLAHIDHMIPFKAVVTK